MADSSEPRLLMVDTRKRINFSWIAEPGDLFLAHAEKDGTIILVPAVITTLAPDLPDSTIDFLNDPTIGRSVTTRPKRSKRSPYYQKMTGRNDSTP